MAAPYATQQGLMRLKEERQTQRYASFRCKNPAHGRDIVEHLTNITLFPALRRLNFEEDHPAPPSMISGPISSSSSRDMPVAGTAARRRHRLNGYPDQVPGYPRFTGAPCPGTRVPAGAPQDVGGGYQAPSMCSARGLDFVVPAGGLVVRTS